MPINPEFVPWMQSEVEKVADQYGCATHRAFPAWCLEFVLDVEGDQAYDQTETLSQGDGGLDGWHFDDEAGVFHLIQAKYPNNPLTTTVPPGPLDSLIKAALLLEDPAAIEDGPHHARLTKIALALQQARLDSVTICLDVFVAGSLSNDAEEQLQSAVTALGAEYTLAVYDVARLSEIKDALDPIADLADEVVSLQMATHASYFSVDDLEIPGVQRAAVASVDGRSIADAVDLWGARLFHGNVRYYLKRKNRVNQGMLQTLNSEDGRRAFRLYNNGLTIVSEGFEIEHDGGLSRLRVTNPQIVNGAQTSSVLHLRRAHLSPGDVAVQCRVIAVNQGEQGRAILEKISEFTNSQSPVKRSDLRSNDARHKKLQRAFEMLPTHVFYERRRGEWQSLQPAQRAQYQGGIVTKEEVGQRYLAFSGMPAASVSRKDEIFGDFESKAFNTETSAHVYMLAVDLYRRADALMSASGEPALLKLVPGLAGLAGDSGSTQLEGLRRARALVCAHAIALARAVLEWRYSEIGPVRAQELRKRFSDASDPTSEFVWRHVFRAIRSWYSTVHDKTTLKSDLQRNETIEAMVLQLHDILVDADREALSPI